MDREARLQWETDGDGSAGICTGCGSWFKGDTNLCDACNTISHIGLRVEDGHSLRMRELKDQMDCEGIDLSIRKRPFRTRYVEPPNYDLWPVPKETAVFTNRKGVKFTCLCVVGRFHTWMKCPDRSVWGQYGIICRNRERDINDELCVSKDRYHFIINSATAVGKVEVGRYRDLPLERAMGNPYIVMDIVKAFLKPGMDWEHTELGRTPEEALDHMKYMNV